jgi:tetratricopeptide (TPR) repeat protein
MTAKYEEEMLKIVGPGKPNPADALTHYANYLLAQDRLDDAERYVLLLKEAAPKALTALELEAELLKRRKLKPQLLSLLEAWGSKFPDQIGQVGDVLAKHGFLTEAERAYKDFVSRKPDQRDRVLALASFYATTGRASAAMKILNEAWGSLPHERVAQVALSVYDSPAAAKSEKQQVRTWVESVVKTQAGSVLKGRLADMRVEDGRTEEAISLFREILVDKPDDVGALNNFAWTLALVEPPRTEEALRMIDHAIEVLGSNPTLFDTRAVIRIRRGHLDEALTDINAAHELPTTSPRTPQFLDVHLAWIYQGKGQIAEARQAFRQAEAKGYRLEASGRLERPFISKLRQDLGLGAEVSPASRPTEHAGG